MFDGAKTKRPTNFDYNKGLVWQMLFKDWTFEEYHAYIHTPKMLINPTRKVLLFEFWPLELLTMTPFWAIPMFWGPVAAWHIS